MEDSQETLSKSLANLGVPIPLGASTIKDLTPLDLVSICSHSLALIHRDSSFSTSYPESMADRFKICSELASAIKKLGYVGEISFHQLLYPSEEDLHKLVRFLVERLSESSEARKSANKEEIQSELERLQNLDKELGKEVTIKSSELHHLEEERDLLEEAADLVLNDQRPIDLNVLQLNEQTDVAKQHIEEIKSERDTIKKPLEEQKRSLGEAICVKNPAAREKLEKLREIELEMEDILSETKRREEEISVLSRTVKLQQPKSATRRSYVERIKEITKNSWKQDADIARILKETRELQLESNSIQERLHRTYTLVDETLFRGAKKDPVGRQTYRLLTSIHESFEQMSEKILATDRTKREVADLEGKLAAKASQHFSVDKLQSDLDAIRMENEFLRRSIREN